MHNFLFKYSPQNQDQTLRYIITLLSQVVHQSKKPGSLRERVSAFTMEVNERYRGNETNCDQQVMRTFNTFKNLLAFFDCYHDNKHEEALDILSRTKLVPLSMNDLDSCVQNFKK